MQNWFDTALIILLFIGGWVVLMNLISAWGGWRSLAEFYRAERPFSGTRFHGQSVRLRAGMGYNGILTAGANSQGLYLSLFFLFRLGHPTLFIPWEDVSGTARRVLWVKAVVLRFEKCPKIPFWISKRLAEKLSGASGVRFFSDENM